MSQDTKSAVKLDTSRNNAAAEKATQTAIETGSRIGQSAVDATARIGQAAAKASAEMSHAAQNHNASASNEFTRWFSDIKMPTMFNLQAITEFNRRNVESMNACYKIALEGMQSYSRRQMEVLQQATRDLCEASRHMTTQEAAQVKTAHQLDAAKQRFESNLSNLRELQDLVRRSTTESMDVLNRRISEALTEVKAMVENAQSHARPV
jgi:phasin family protein